MEKQTLALLDSALDAVRRDLSPRVEELAQKSTAGTLAPEELATGARLIGNTRSVVNGEDRVRLRYALVRRGWAP